MPIRVLLGQFGAEVAGSGVDVDLALAEAAFKLGVAGLDVMGRVAGHHDHKVSLSRARQLAHLGRGLRKALSQALEVVDELGALL